VEDLEAREWAHRTPEPGGTDGAGSSRWRGQRASGSPVEDTEGADGGHRRSPVEDELGHRGWREPGSGTTTGTPVASRPKAVSRMATSIGSGWGQQQRWHRGRWWRHRGRQWCKRVGKCW
jgi:hypothetical protein